MDPNAKIKHLTRKNRVLTALLLAICVPPLVGRILSVCEDIPEDEVPEE